MTMSFQRSKEGCYNTLTQYSVKGSKKEISLGVGVGGLGGQKNAD